ncbi:hypothetical protein NEOC84_000915|nr:hypothetical protein [Neochlamydia sp. AcF84]
MGEKIKVQERRDFQNPPLEASLCAWIIKAAYDLSISRSSNDTKAAKECKSCLWGWPS